MIVYLTSERGSQVPMKLSTMQIFTSLDSLIDETINDLIITKNNRESTDINLLECINGWGFKQIYFGNLDSNIPLKKVGKKEWKSIIEDYTIRHPDKIAKIELIK